MKDMNNNPSGLDQKLQRLIQDTVEFSFLSLEEKEEIKKELETNLYDQAYELKLAGVSEHLIRNEIVNNFGTPKEIGRQLYKARRRFAWIPWFGPMLYYKPLQWGAKLFLVHLVGMVFSTIFFIAIASFMDGLDLMKLSENLILLPGIFFIIFRILAIVVPNAAASWWLVRYKHITNNLFEIILFSYVPFVLAILYYALDYNFKSQIFHIRPGFDSDPMLESVMFFFLFLAPEVVVFSILTLIFLRSPKSKKESHEE